MVGERMRETYLLFVLFDVGSYERESSDMVQLVPVLLDLRAVD